MDDLLDELLLGSEVSPKNFEDILSSVEIVEVSTNSIEIQSVNISKKVVDLPFPKDGIKLSAVDEFVRRCEITTSLQGMTTTDVNTNFLKPATIDMKSSYCDLLRSNSPESVGVASVFISHAWRFRFLDVVEALHFHFGENNDVILWFDLFSNNQWSAPDLDFTWWSTTFKSAIEQFGHTVLILSPWDNPIPLGRAWCLFEIYCSVLTGSKFEVAMSESEQKRFVSNIESFGYEVVKKMIGVVDLEHSVAWNPRDKDCIFEAVRQTSGGFDALNSAIFERLREWVVATTKSAIERTVDEVELLSLRSCLGELLHGQGRYDECLIELNHCFSQRCMTLGSNDPQTLFSMNLLAIAYRDRGDLTVAETLSFDCLEKRKVHLGSNHPQTLLSMNILGTIYSFQKKHALAMQAHSECFERRKVHPDLGPNHADTLISQNNLANVYFYQGAYSLAQQHFVDCLERRQRVLGENHPDTLKTMNNLGNVYKSLGVNDKAEHMLAQVLQKRTTKLGRSHPDTLRSLFNVASIFEKSRPSEAEALFEECLTLRRKTLRVGNSDLLNSIRSLGCFYKNTGRLNRAEPLLREHLAEKMAALGMHHRDTVAARNSLATVLEMINGKDDEEVKSLRVSPGAFGELGGRGTGGGGGGGAEEKCTPPPLARRKSGGIKEGFEESPSFLPRPLMRAKSEGNSFQPDTARRGAAGGRRGDQRHSSSSSGKELR